MSAKILLVDDEPDLLRMVGYSLHREGYTVSVAQNGAEALEKVSTDIPDLIILDVMMPDTDGYAGYRWCLPSQRTSAVKI